MKFSKLVMGQFIVQFGLTVAVLGVANAATFNIANGDVAGLSAAIQTANANCAPATTINLAPGGTYTLTSVAENPSEFNAPLAVGLPAIVSSSSIAERGNLARLGGGKTSEYWYPVGPLGLVVRQNIPRNMYYIVPVHKNTKGNQ